MPNEPAKNTRKPRAEATRETFVTLASKRTSTAIKALANVAKLPTKHRKPEDVQAIVGALRAAIDTVEKRLQSTAPPEPEFTLKP